MKSPLRVILKCLLTASLFAASANLRAQSTAFTYQGLLNVSNAPATGNYDLYFTLYATNVLATNSVAVVGPLAETNTPVSNGLFTVSLDFGRVFTGTNYWVQISASTNLDTNNILPLTPLLPITPTPYAISAGTASNLLGTLPVAQLSGTISVAQLSTNVVTNNASSITLSGAFSGILSGNGAGLTNLSAAAISGANASALTFSNANNVFVGSFTGDGTGLSNVIATSVIDGFTNSISNALDFTNAGNSYVGTGITNYGLYLETNSSSNGAFALITTNAHLHLTDEWGTTYNTHTNGTLTITMTNGTSFNWSNGSLTLTSNGVSLQYSQGSLTLSSNLTISNNAIIGGALNVSGLITGNGAGLTNLSVTNLAAGTAAISISGNAATATSAATADFATNAGTANIASNVVGGLTISNAIVTNSAFYGDGGGLTNLSAAALTGALPVISGANLTNLPLQGGTNVTLTTNGNIVSINTSGGGSVPLNGTNTWTGTNTFTNTVIATNGTSNVFAGTFIGDGSGLTNVTNFVATNFTGSNFSGNGAGLTNLPLQGGTNVTLTTNGNIVVINSSGGGGTGVTNASVTNIDGSVGGLAALISGSTISLTATNNTNVTSPAQVAALISTATNALGLGTAAFSNASQFYGTNVSLQAGSVILSNIAAASGGAIPSNTLNGVNGYGLTNLALEAGANVTLTTNGALVSISSSGGGGGVQLNGTNIWTGTNTFTNAFVATNAQSLNQFAGTFNGNGASLTQLNATQLTLGTVPYGAYPSGSGGTFLSNTGAAVVWAPVPAGGGATSVTVANSNGSASGLSVLTNAGVISLTETNNTNVATPAMVTGLSNALGTAAFSSSTAFQPASTALSNFSTLGTAAFQPASTALTNLANANGGALTNLSAANIVGTLTNTTTGNAATVTTVAYSNYPVGSSGTILSNTGSAVVWAPSPVPAGAVSVDTTNITTNVSGQLTAGTNVARLSAANTFTGASNTFTAPVSFQGNIDTQVISPTNITLNSAFTGTWSTNLAIYAHHGTIFVTNTGSTFVGHTIFTNFFFNTMTANPTVIVQYNGTSEFPAVPQSVTSTSWTCFYTTSVAASSVTSFSWMILP